MATIVSHFLVGWGVYRFFDGRNSAGCLGPVVAGSLAMLPDVDTLFMPWVRYGDPWGHRGMTHSLAFAVVVGTAAALYTHSRAAFPSGFAGLAATLALATASHGLIDAMTDGGLGVALLAPFDERRIFFGVRPIPVSPITMNPFEPRVWHVIAWEIILLWPWALLLATVRRPVPSAVRWAAYVGVVVSAVIWSVRCSS